MTLEPIVYTYFSDRANRPVFEEERGQFVLDDEGNLVDGVWYIPRDECPQLLPESQIIQQE